MKKPCKAPKLFAEERVSRYPLVSVITPSFNQAEFIEETIKSVLSQDYPNIEYLVIDGGSTDNTLRILEKHSDGIRWISETDKGQADAVNKGFKIAKGEIVGWLNSDDTYCPGAICKAVKAFLANPGTSMVYGNAYFIDREGAHTGKYPAQPFDLRHLADVCFICQPTVFLNSKVIKKVGMLDASLQTCMDFDYWIRIGKKYDPSKIIYLHKEFLANSRMYGENKSLGKSERHYSEIMETVKKHFGYVSNRWVCGYLYAATLGEKREKRYKKVNFVKKMFIWFYFIFKLFAKRWAWIFFWRYVIYSINNMMAPHGTSYQGTVYNDGWVSDFCILSFGKRGERDKLLLEGRHMWPHRGALKIDVIINGEKVKEIRVKQRGKFERIVDLPEEHRHRDLLIVMLKSNKTFVPANYGIHDDRRLSFVLKKIKLC